MVTTFTWSTPPEPRWLQLPRRRIWLMAQGLDPEPVRTQASEVQTLGHGKVLPPNTRDPQVIRVYLMHMAHKLGERLRRNQLVADRFLFGLFVAGQRV